MCWLVHQIGMCCENLALELTVNTQSQQKHHNLTRKRQKHSILFFLYLTSNSAAPCWLGAGPPVIIGSTARSAFRITGFVEIRARWNEGKINSYLEYCINSHNAFLMYAPECVSLPMPVNFGNTVPIGHLSWNMSNPSIENSARFKKKILGWLPTASTCNFHPNRIGSDLSTCSLCEWQDQSKSRIVTCFVCMWFQN